MSELLTGSIRPATGTIDDNAGYRPGMKALAINLRSTHSTMASSSILITSRGGQRGRGRGGACSKSLGRARRKSR
jgi:hypothetical protein